MTRTEVNRISPGAVYLYTPAWPRGCQGHRYRAHRIILSVPSYQEQVLVEALSGPDAGLWFSCNLMNFATRYELAADQGEPAPAGEGDPPPEKPVPAPTDPGKGY